MTQISEKSKKAAQAGAHAWLARSDQPRSTRHNPTPASLSQSDIAAQHNANLALMKKYIYLLKAGKPLPSIKSSISGGGRPMALSKAEEEALIQYIQDVENSAFAVTEAAIRNYASFIRFFRVQGPKTKLSTAWPGNKESLTSTDAISAAGQVIPSFLIFAMKSLLEEYAFADIDPDTVLTHTETGFNNSQRALQWLQHFDFHSFAKSSDFDGFTIEEWFGQQAKEQEAFIRKLREEARPLEENRLKLRGRAAAKAKASREAEEAAAWEEVRKTFVDPDTIEKQQRQLLRWEQAEINERFFMITTVPKSHLEAIPNLEKWLEENQHPFQDDEASEATEASDTIVVADDFISVASTPKLPSLPGSSVSDDNEIDIITCSQVAATRGVTSNLAIMPFG
ncbi:unnamed protein product, partial [Fusarium langsethiae]